ncbi:MAG TPA: glycosyltransferase, partial [Chitinophagaceae bacterium]|nr:glycosyltransferase [Chitinophagaceae bacterium]
KILKIAPQLNGIIMILRGRPGKQDIFKSSINCTIVNHLTTSEFQQVFSSSEFIIGRSGYTTVMEILSLQKRSMLIPTPGQTEQEYLGRHLMQQQWCYSCEQDADLLSHIKKAKEFQFIFPSLNESSLPAVIEDFVNVFWHC